MKGFIAFLLQGLRFGVASICGPMLYWGSLYLLTEVIHFWWVASSFIGFLLNNGVSFWLMKYFTFQNHNSQPAVVRKQGVQYFSLKAAIYLVSLVVSYLMVKFNGTNYLLAQLIVIPVQPLLSFMGQRRIFRKEALSISK